MKPVKLLDAVTSTGAGTAIKAINDRWNEIVKNKSYQAIVSGTGAVTATVVIEFSNDGINWVTGPNIALSGTTTATDGFSAADAWAYVRANLTVLTGTNATVTVLMGM